MPQLPGITLVEDIVQSVVSQMLADTPPMGEAGTPQAGTGAKATRQDHRHPRLSSTASGTLNASGEATIVFTREFTAKPSVIVTLVEATEGQPVTFKVKSWTMTGANYTGCVIKGYRAQTIPTNLVTLLLGGVFNLFAGSVTGAEFTLIAIQPSSAS